ncbi:MAG: glycosyltransferase family 2 protein [Clostridia bacterium]|nr:glycosyltransferase family 2 protein [Clostridia bacterium]
MSKVSFVVPVYNEEIELEKFYTRLSDIIKTIEMEYEIVFVDDGSKDNSSNILKQIATNNQNVKVVTLSRNFGQQSAIICGFKQSTGDCVIELDVKLDLPFEIIPQMIEKWKSGIEVVHTQNKNKGNGFTRFFKRIYLKFLSWVAKINIPLDTDEFKLYDKKVINEICALTEQDKYVMAITSWVGFKQATITYSNKMKSKNRKNIFRKAMGVASAGIIGNSTWPLCLAFWFGTLVSIASTICMTIFTTCAMFKVYFPLTAWLFPTIGTLFSFLFMIQSFSNTYLGRIYNEVKGRPDYIISNTINIDENK